jgi:glycosyltransferase involved in cell wall biosynthesis
LIGVLHVITDLEVAGAEMTLSRIVTRPGRHTVTVAVIALGRRGPLAARIEAAGVPVFALGIRAGVSAAGALWRLVGLLRRFRPDVVQTWLYHADVAGLVAATIARVPHVVWNIRCAELDPRDHPRSLPTLLRTLAFASRWPDAVICNSEAGRRAHERIGYTPRRWEIIPNGFDTNAFRPSRDAPPWLKRELGISDEAMLVGLLARFHPMKDHGTFINAAKIVTAAKPNVHFVAAGSGVESAPAITRLLDDLELRGHVHLLPEQTDASRFLAALDVAVSSSYGEAFPNVVGEAMACGTPCVVTDVGDSARIVGDAGVIVEARHPAALAAGITRILELTAAARESLGSSARARIISEFSIDRVAARYDLLYANLMGEQMTTDDASICAE